jgi:hypothetical protein
MNGGIVPAGMPPGTEYVAEERAPEGVVYFRVYGVLACVLYGLVALMGGALLVSPLFLDRSAIADTGVGFLVAGGFYACVGLAHVVPALIALCAGRRPWVHVLGIVVLGMGMFNVCCLPINIPLLVVWMKPETRRWYGAS